MFTDVQVGDFVAVHGYECPVVKTSPARFWAQVDGELVKFSRSNGREYGGHRQAELVASPAPTVDLVLCETAVCASPLVELLAAVLQTPNAPRLAQDVLNGFDSLTALRRATVAELARIVGSESLAARIKAAIEFSRRLLSAEDIDRPKITCPADAANLVMLEMRDLRQEHFRLILLDTRNNVLGMPTVFVGSVNSISLRLADIFRHAIERSAAAIIVVHNHPSGDPSPSPEDVSVTRQLVSAGKLLDLNVLDHLVIGDGRYVSLKEQGLGFLD